MLDRALLEPRIGDHDIGRGCERQFVLYTLLYHLRGQGGTLDFRLPGIAEREDRLSIVEDQCVRVSLPDDGNEVGVMWPADDGNVVQTGSFSDLGRNFGHPEEQFDTLRLQL